MRLSYLPFLFIIVTWLAGCGATNDTKVAEAILEAQIFLGQRQCDNAINILTAAGDQSKNALYVRTLASAYACKVGYDTPSFVTDDLPLLGTPSPLGSLARFHTSVMTSPTHDTFLNLEKAINTLLFAGGIPLTDTPSPEKREARFESSEAADINIQLFYLLAAQLGNYIKYYAQTDASGMKTACITDYPVALHAAIALLPAPTTCVPATDNGKPELGGLGSYNIKRHCQGVVLLNNMRVVLQEIITYFASDILADLNVIDTAFSAAETAFLLVDNTAGGNAVLNVLNQTTCEEENAADETHLANYFAFFFETMTR